jgi:hypothetical protein
LSKMRKRPVFQGRAHYTPRKCRLSRPVSAPLAAPASAPEPSDSSP